MRLGPGDEDEVARVVGCTEEKAGEYLSSRDLYVVRPSPGVILFAEPLMPGAALVHQFAVPEARGKVALAATREAISWAFRETDFEKLVGLTPAWNRAACLMASLVGFRREGLLRRARRGETGMEDVIVFGLQKDEREG